MVTKSGFLASCLDLEKNFFFRTLLLESYYPEYRLRQLLLSKPHRIQPRFQRRMKKTKTKDQNLEFGMGKLMILIQKMARTLINEPKAILTPGSHAVPRWSSVGREAVLKLHLVAGDLTPTVSLRLPWNAIIGRSAP
ncbi:hypothetical protein AKJ16_DCAP15304 [Drosera capensis]